MKRATKTEYLGEFYIGALTGMTFDEAVKYLKKTESHWKALRPEAINLRLDLDESDYCVIMIEREETDKEVEARQKAAEKAKEARRKLKLKEIELAERQKEAIVAAEKKQLAELIKRYGVL